MTRRIVAVIIAVIAIIAMGVTAFAAERMENKKMKSSGLIKNQEVAVPVWSCPPGWYNASTSTDHYVCKRNRPANPCAPGYMVKWGHCAADCNSSAPECCDGNYQCIVIKESVNFTCPNGFTPDAGACELRCNLNFQYTPPR